MAEKLHRLIHNDLMSFRTRTISVLISFLIILAFIGILYLTNNSKNRLKVDNVSAQTSPDWSMAGANPQRTSWTPENLPGNIATVWVKPIEPYISQHVQVIGAEGKVFVSTTKGLYAFDASSGTQAWVY